MKYKIKVKVMQDGSRNYYPMVKTHWWQLWRHVDKWGTIGRKTWCDTEKEAREVLSAAKERLESRIVSRTYDIPYKEE